METRNELNEQYESRDPWGYISNRDDWFRSELIQSVILHKISHRVLLESVLDLGCGEGFITRNLFGSKIYGYDESDVAMSRLPMNVIRLKKEEITARKYDLVVATGVIYPHYDWEWLIKTIKKCASGLVLTCHLKDVEHKYIGQIGKQTFDMEFDYRDSREKLRLFEV